MKQCMVVVVLLASMVFAGSTTNDGLTIAVAFVSKETPLKNSQEMIISKIEERLVRCEKYQVITFQSRTSIDSLLKLPESEWKNNLDRLITVSIDTSENIKVLTLKMIEPGSFVICASVQEVMRGEVSDFIRIIDTMVETLIERETEYCKNKNQLKSGEEVRSIDLQQKDEGKPSGKQMANSTSSYEERNRQMQVWNRYAVGAVLVILMMMMVTLSSQPKN